MGTKIDRKMASKMLTALAVVALAAALVLMFWPKTGLATLAEAKKKSIAKFQADTRMANAEEADFKTANAARTWNVSLQDVGPAVLSSVTRLAKTRFLKLSTFRPQKTVELDGVTQAPYLLAVEGAYPELIAFVKDLENPKTKLAVTMLQLTSSDASSDRVTATIALAAFIEPVKSGAKNGKL